MTPKHEIIKTLAKMAPVTCGDLAECLRMPWAYLHDLLEELAVQGAVVQNDSGEWEAV